MDIKKVIRGHGMTLQEVAAQMRNNRGGIGITQPSMSSIVSGNPTIDKLKEIANIVGCSLSELVSEDSDSITITCPHCGKVINLKIDDKPE